MYNEQRKQDFIRKYTESDQTKKLLLHVFDSIMTYEEKYSTDFCMMNVEQAQEAFNCASGVSASGVTTIHMILKAYVRWCAANGCDVSGSVSQLQIDVSDKMRDCYVASPIHLLMALNEAFPNPDLNDIEYVYRSFLWLGFMGLQESEAIEVTSDELDFDSLHLNYAGNAQPYLIYRESLHDLKMAAELKEFREPRGKRGVIKPRAPGAEILRGKVSKRSLGDIVNLTFRPTISRAFKDASLRYSDQGLDVPVELSLKLSFKHVYMSGIFYRAYERERIGIPPSFSDIVIRERRNAKESKFSRNYTERKLLNILIRNMEQDYDNWKNIFS